MNLRRTISKANRNLDVAQLARTVARQTHLTVFARVDHRARYMSLAEAKGYIRARAGEFVAHQVDLVVRSLPNHIATARPALYAASINAVVRLVVADMQKIGYARTRGVHTRHAA